MATSIPDQGILIAEQYLTIEQLLEEPLLSDARVVAGTQYLSRGLTWVLPLSEVTAWPEAFDCVALHVRSEALVADDGLFESAYRGAAALVIDGPVPAEFDHSAFPAGLVVIEIAARLGFAELNRLVTERTLNRELLMARYATHLHGCLSASFHRGAGLQVLVRQVSDLARIPAMALNAQGKAIAHHGFAIDVVDALSASLRRTLATASKPGRRLAIGQVTRVERVSGPGGCVWTCIASQILVGNASQGWVALLAPLAIPAARELAYQRVIAEQAAGVVAAEMVRLRSVEEAEECARGDFVQALAHGSFASELELRDRAAYHEFDTNSVFGVFVAQIPHRVDNAKPRLLRLARYAANSCTSALRADTAVIGNVVVIVQTMRDLGQAEIDCQMVDFARAMCHELERRCGTSPTLAYSRAAHGARDICDTYRQARIALSIAVQLGRTGANSHEELRSFTVLADLTNTEHSRQLIRQYVMPLQSGPRLLETLTTYLAHGCNVADTARALNLHRNTLLTKLDKIAGTVKLDIRSPENQFTLWLAIRLHTLTQAQTAAEREVTC